MGKQNGTVAIKIERTQANKMLRLGRLNWGILFQEGNYAEYLQELFEIDIFF